MSTYNITPSSSQDGLNTLLKLSFGAQAQNDVIVRDAITALAASDLKGGTLVCLNGPASLPVACAITHGVAHIFKAVAVFDPKLAGYVVSVSHDENRPVGTIIPAAEVDALFA